MLHNMLHVGDYRCITFFNIWSPGHKTQHCLVIKNVCSMCDMWFCFYGICIAFLISPLLFVISLLILNKGFVIPCCGTTDCITWMASWRSCRNVNRTQSQSYFWILRNGFVLLDTSKDLQQGDRYTQVRRGQSSKTCQKWFSSHSSRSSYCY